MSFGFTSNIDGRQRRMSNFKGTNFTALRRCPLISDCRNSWTSFEVFCNVDATCKGAP